MGLTCKERERAPFPFLEEEGRRLDELRKDSNLMCLMLAVLMSDLGVVLALRCGGMSEIICGLSWRDGLP